MYNALDILNVLLYYQRLSKNYNKQNDPRNQGTRGVKICCLTSQLGFDRTSLRLSECKYM